jgi:hypothetical protein
MAKKDIVVIGASAGARTILPSVLSKAGPLLAAQPEDGDGIEPGRSRKATSA